MSADGERETFDLGFSSSSESEELSLDLGGIDVNVSPSHARTNKTSANSEPRNAVPYQRRADQQQPRNDNLSVPPFHVGAIGITMAIVLLAVWITEMAVLGIPLGLFSLFLWIPVGLLLGWVWLHQHDHRERQVLDLARAVRELALGSLGILTASVMLMFYQSVLIYHHNDVGEIDVMDAMIMGWLGTFIVVILEEWVKYVLLTRNALHSAQHLTYTSHIYSFCALTGFGYAQSAVYMLLMVADEPSDAQNWGWMAVVWLVVGLASFLIHLVTGYLIRVGFVVREAEKHTVITDRNCCDFRYLRVIRTPVLLRTLLYGLMLVMQVLLDDVVVVSAVSALCMVVVVLLLFWAAYSTEEKLPLVYLRVARGFLLHRGEPDVFRNGEGLMSVTVGRTVVAI